jgi:hypothetical protein
MLSAISSIMETGHASKTEEQLDQEISDLVHAIVDPAGTFYKFSLAHSLLRRARFPKDRNENKV